jgi:hypothetical protein
MGRVCGSEVKSITGWENLKVKGHLKDLDVAGGRYYN